MKARGRKAISECQAITRFRNERKGRLLVRYRGVDHRIGKFSGTLGAERDFGTGSTNVTGATERIMQRMCTPMHGAPRCYKGEKPTLLPGLFRHLRESVMCIPVDSTSDEPRGAEIMRSNTLADPSAQTTRSHGLRSRPFPRPRKRRAAVEALL